MKLKIEFTENKEPVPFTYLSNLNGYLHKILGVDNKYHDGISLYSTSFLHGGGISKNKKHLEFPNGAKWFISSPHKDFILDLIHNIYEHTEFAFGMELDCVNVIDNKLKSNNGLYYFKTKSPILLKQSDFESRKNTYYTFEDDNEITSSLMKRVVMKKAEKNGLSFSENEFDICFDNEYLNKKIKWIEIKSIKNKVSSCPIIIKTEKKEIANFVHDVGVGHSTGSGFGFLLQ